MKIEYLFIDRLYEIMYGDINFAPYYMHSVLEMKCQTLGPSFASNL